VAQALHGGMMQKQRDRVMGLFRTQKANLLIATDVAARGLDIEHVSHVVNYDVPNSPEVYLHRIGRTGRAGRGGTAITLAEPREQRHLRSIEGFTKTRLEIGKVPTVADLRAKRLELTRASLRERLVAADFDDVRVVVESLSDEFDTVDIAAAAVKMAHDALGGTEEREIPTPAAAPQREREQKQDRDRGAGPKRRFDKRERSLDGNGIRLFIAAGRDAGIRPGDLVGAITGEAGVPSQSLGAIEIADRFSLVEVPEALADRIIAALKATKIRGKKVNVRREKTI
jgi:ATP-dependent RNA helicase DeaD